MIRRLALIGSVAAALALSTGCDAADGTRKAHADLSPVRHAVRHRLGSPAVEVRIADATMLSVTVVNNPIHLRPAHERQAQARELAKVAYDAYPERATLAGVKIAYVARGSFALLSVSAFETHRFEPASLQRAPAATSPTA